MDTSLRRYDIRKNDPEISKLGTGFRGNDSHTTRLCEEAKQRSNLRFGWWRKRKNNPENQNWIPAFAGMTAQGTASALDYGKDVARILERLLRFAPLDCICL